MSEVLSRPSAPRGRGSARGARGGYSSRGGRAGPRSSKTDTADVPSMYEDEGEIGQLKKKYATELPTLKELFPDWTDEDLVFALEDANGDLETAIEHITEGNVSQWGEVKKKTTDRSRSKVKEASKIQGSAAESAPVAVRGGRGRGGFEGRGGRARGDRGRGGRGGRAGAHANGVRGEKPTTTADGVESSGPADPVGAGDAATTKKPVDVGEWAEIPADSAKETPKNTPKLPEPAKKGWASLFAKPAPPPPQKKPPHTAPVAAPLSQPVEPKSATLAPTATAAAAADIPDEKAPGQPGVPLSQTATEIPSMPPVDALEPSKDDLTKMNLEQVPDVSIPPATATAASTVASVQDPHSLPPVTPQSRGASSGYAASAFKATGGPGRSSSFQRRVLEQQEAVVMPANHAVDRAAVQFGSMGLNGSEDVDIDEEREEAETRAQPPQHSPVAPRAALPPSAHDAPSIARPAPGLPPVPQATAADAPFNDFGRYGDSQKQYDPFSHQASQPQSQVHEPFSNQAPAQAAVTTGSEYSPFYASDQQRLPYNYYGAYPSQETPTAQRTVGGFGVSGAEGQPHVPVTQPPGRYGHTEAPNSGHNTPNPTVPGATQSQQPSSQHIPGGQQGGPGGYGYGYPYYSNPHYAASYMNQMNQQHQYGRNRPMYDDARRYEDHYMSHNQQYGYGNQYAPYGKGGMYGQPFSYDHSSSPANGGGFNQGLPARDSVYGRTGSAQPENQQTATTGNSAFGSGIPDVFGRSQSGFGQNQPISQQQPVTSEETTKGFEASKTGGPSPSLAQANRPGSATNSVPGQPQSQTSLPPLQGQHGQQGFGGYPHLNPQYGGGLGGLGAHQAGQTQNHHQGSGYGNYGGGAGFGNYYGNTGRGGWGGNYGH